MTFPSVVPRTPVTISPFPRIGEIETALVAWEAGSPARASDAWLPVIGCSPLLGVIVGGSWLGFGGARLARAGLAVRMAHSVWESTCFPAKSRVIEMPA